MTKLIIFDYDGVIIDSFPSVFDVYKIICEELNKVCPDSIEKFRKIYGYSSRESLRNLGIDDEDYEKAGIIFKREILKTNPPIFEGISEVLEELSTKYRLVIISSAYKEEVEQKLERFDLRKYFSRIIAREHHKRLKKTHAIKEIIFEERISPDEVILIGDRDIDYDESVESGLKNIILVDYGWGYTKEKHPQKIKIETPMDILNAIEVINTTQK